MRLIKIVFKEWGILFALIFVGMMVGILEGLGIAVFLPIFQNQGSFNTSDVPLFLRIPFEYLADQSLKEKIFIISALLLGINILRLFFVFIDIKLSFFIRTKVLTHYKMQCMKRLMDLKIGFYNNKRLSDFQLLFTNRIESHIGMIVEVLCNALPAVLTAFILTALLLSSSWKITIILLLFLVILGILLELYARLVRKSGNHFIQSEGKFNSILHDILHGMKVVRLFNAQDFMLKVFQSKTMELNTEYTRMSTLTRLVGPFFELSGVIVIALILICGTVLLDGENNQKILLTLFTFVLILARLIPSLKQINHARGAIAARLPGLKEADDFLNGSSEGVLANGNIAWSGFAHCIKFDNVEFSYSDRDKIVLTNISLTIQKGQKVGILGASGSGKSTIIELLLRFYDPQKGSVKIDGIDLRDLDITSFRKHIGVVPQEVFLFNDTIRNNIAFAKPDADDEEIVKAALRANAHEFINNLPQGYLTSIGDRGVLLSGGQRQRIAIARAILADPQILIFDEATSALDTASERLVQQSLNDVSKGKTVLMIAHRLSTVSECDQIIVIENGIIVEQGLRQELLDKDGIYKKLLNQQATVL